MAGETRKQRAKEPSHVLGLPFYAVMCSGMLNILCYLGSCVYVYIYFITWRMRSNANVPPHQSHPATTNGRESTRSSTASWALLLLHRPHAQPCTLTPCFPARLRNQHSDKILQQPIATMCPQHSQVLNFKSPTAIPQKEVNLPVVIE